MGGLRGVRIALVVALLTAALVVVPSVAAPRRSLPAADAYAATDLPPLPTYCHPEVSGSTWTPQVPGCTIGFSVQGTLYPATDDQGHLIDYGGPVMNRQSIGVTGYGSASSPPTFIVTANYAMWQDDGLRRVDWKRLTFYPFLPGNTTSFFADPVSPCGLKATACAYRFDATSLSTAVSSGLGSPPKWVHASITVPVQHDKTDGDGDATFPYGSTDVTIGFYRTDNKNPVANFEATPVPGTPIKFHFDGRKSVDLDGQAVVRWIWDFGDGTSAEGTQVDHTYATAGNYRVKLRVLDPDGAEGATFQDLENKMHVTLSVSKVPAKVGDEFDVVATASNDSPSPMHCMKIDSATDIRPATSFTTISKPPDTDVDNTIPRGGSVSGTWHFKLTGAVPTSFDVYAIARASRTGDCTGDNSTNTSGHITVPLTARKAWYPFSSWASLVARMYQDVVNRKPTSAESSSWVAKLTNKTATPGSLAASLRASQENLDNVDPTVRLYRAFLGRIPDSGGLVFWVKRKRSGEWKLIRIADYFAGSSEFKKKYGTLTNRAFVTLIYTDVLGRTADKSGVDYWTKQLDNKRKSRGGVMVGFSESNEYRTKQAQNTDAAVGHVFLLGRSPTTTESNTWASREKSGTTHTTLLQELIDSAAYATRITG